MSWTRAAQVLAVAAACGCDRPATKRPAAQAAASASASPAPSVAPAGAASSVRPAQLPDGCHRDVAPDTEARPDLAQLLAACGRGMKPVQAEPDVVTLRSGKPKLVDIASVESSKCIRVAATGTVELQRLRVEIIDASARVVAAGDLGTRFALAPASGPLCVTDAATHKIRLIATDGAGPVSVQTWRAQ